MPSYIPHKPDLFTSLEHSNNSRHQNFSPDTTKSTNNNSHEAFIPNSRQNNINYEDFVVKTYSDSINGYTMSSSSSNSPRIIAEDNIHQSNDKLFENKTEGSFMNKNFHENGSINLNSHNNDSAVDDSNINHTMIAEIYNRSYNESESNFVNASIRDASNKTSVKEDSSNSVRDINNTPLKEDFKKSEKNISLTSAKGISKNSAKGMSQLTGTTGFNLSQESDRLTILEMPVYSIQNPNSSTKPQNFTTSEPISTSYM